MSRFSLRVRLALLIGLMLVLCGSALLAISYGLVSSNLSAPLPGALPSATHGIGKAGPSLAGTPDPRVAAAVAAKAAGAVAARDAAALATKAEAQRALRKRTLDQLLTQYLAILAGIVLVAVALGWLLAGQLLRSVRRITSMAERVTGRNLNERIGLGGPRDELRELADAFDGMLARLDGVFSAQRRFIADASHELRTPLAAMRTEVEVLAADPHATLADIQAATLVLRRQLARSEDLIGALLALARSESELVICEPVDLAAVVRKALDDVATDAAACGLRIDTQIAPATVLADRRLLTLLVGNLLANAIKHNHDGGWIRLRTAVDADNALLAVANSGQVVGAEEAHEITQAFRRGGRAHVGDGHGLGLAIVAAVTHAHQGQLKIEPITDGGLQVEVSLPPGADGGLGPPFATSSTNGADVDAQKADAGIHSA